MPFKSKAQRRWMFAAESRGEVPKGTARRWAHETKGRLPERAMKKEGMFFGDREQVEDGQFMKCAQTLEVPKSDKPKKLPLKTPKPKRQHVAPGEATQGAQLPIKEPKPLPKLGSLIGHPGIGRPGIKMANVAQGYGPGTPPSGGGMDVSAGGTAGSPGAAQMGAGAKLKKKGTEKKAELTGERVLKTGKKVGEGAKKGLEEGLEAIEKLPPWAHAAMAGGAGLYGLSKLKKGVKAVARRGAPASGGAVGRLLSKLRRMRGR
jgi:hypothetical protein